MILSGRTIKQLGIISPFHKRTEWKPPALVDVTIGRPIDQPVFTFGVGIAGYDVRVEFDHIGSKRRLKLQPHGFVLASTVEHFTIPNGVLGIVHDKSSWARRGLAVQNTVLEPGWKGYLTVELTNHSNRTLTIYRGSPIAQVVFHTVDDSTAGYRGKYQNQPRGPQKAK